MKHMQGNLLTQQQLYKDKLLSVQLLGCDKSPPSHARQSPHSILNRKHTGNLEWITGGAVARLQKITTTSMQGNLLTHDSTCHQREYHLSYFLHILDTFLGNTKQFNIGTNHQLCSSWTVTNHHQHARQSLRSTGHHIKNVTFPSFSGHLSFFISLSHLQTLNPFHPHSRRRERHTHQGENLL